MDDWDDDEPVKSGTSTPAVAAPPPRAPARGRFAGEDEEDLQDDWDASEGEKPAPAAATAAPPKKKMSLKQKLAEKEKNGSLQKVNGNDDDDLIETTTVQDRRRQAREREMEADMAVASDLMGDMDVKDSKEALQAVLTARPTTKEDFAVLSKQIIAVAIARHEGEPLFAAFAEQLGKDLCENLSAIQTRKISSALSVLGNTKQQEERDKASGKKKAASKPKLGGAKTIVKVDTEAYDDVLDDGDFM